MKLSRHARCALRNFLAWWTGGRRHYHTPRAILAAQEAEREAIRRGCCRDVHAARQRLREARLEGLRQEVGWNR